MINYIGSKYSLIDFIYNAINSIVLLKDFIFADLFAGTGIVGITYRKENKKVISNDIQYYSYVINKHYIENNIQNIDDSLFDYLNNLTLVKGFITNNYSSFGQDNRNYFSILNSQKIDSIRQELEKLYIQNKINKNTYYYYIACLLVSADKISNVASVYGAYLKKLKKSATKDFVLKPIEIIDTIKGKVYNEDINKLINKIEGDILYLDPPYNSRQYCSNYHLLETIAKYDSPKIKGKTGLRDENNKLSDFCYKSKVYNAFDYLIKNAKFKYIFLSYNNEGIMNLEEIKSIMSKYGKYSYEIKNYKRFCADKPCNRNILTNKTQEYLHCLIK